MANNDLLAMDGGFPLDAQTEKHYPIEYKGHGFNTHNALIEFKVTELFSAEGLETVKHLKVTSFKELTDRGVTESALKETLYLGFYNTSKSTYHNSLDEVKKGYNDGDTVELVTYRLSFDGKEMLNSTVLTADLLNEEGQAKYVHLTQEPVKEEETQTSKSQTLSGQISTDPLA